MNMATPLIFVSEAPLFWADQLDEPALHSRAGIVKSRRPRVAQELQQSCKVIIIRHDLASHQNLNDQQKLRLSTVFR